MWQTYYFVTQLFFHKFIKQGKHWSYVLNPTFQLFYVSEKILNYKSAVA